MQTIGIISVFVAGYATSIWSWQLVRPAFVWAFNKATGGTLK